MAEAETLTTEEALRALIKETDKAVAKAQAAMGRIVGKANPETKPDAVTAEPPAAGAPTGENSAG